MNYLGIDIDLTDEKTWAYLRKAECLKGVFQFEGFAASRALKEVGCGSVEDLSLCNALARPGSFSFIKDIADIRAGKRQIEYLHPALEPFLKNTGGKACYQEQTMQISQRLAGFTAKESNVLLKSLGKKDLEKMKSLKEAFINGLKKNNFSQEVAERLFQWLEASANYQFNRSHSVSYSLLGYASAYIKLHHPLQFFTSLLNYTQYEQSQQNEIFDIQSELSHFNIKLLPPSIKCLNANFVIEREGIRFPLKFIRSIGDAGFEKLHKLRDHQISTLDGFMEASFSNGINSRSMEFLIAVGALDIFGEREDILDAYWFLSELQEEVRNHFWTFLTGRSITREVIREFLSFDQIIPSTRKRPAGSGYFKTETTRKKVLAKVEENAKFIDLYKSKKTFCRFMWESYMLGFGYNAKFHPDAVAFKEIDEQHDGQYSAYGFVDEIMFKSSKRGNTYANLALKLDESRSFLLFDKVADGARNAVSEGDFVQITISKDNGKTNVSAIRNLTSQSKEYLFWERKKHAIQE